MKFQRGDKVIPLRKSTCGNLFLSVVWNACKERGYMYVSEYRDNIVVCTREDDFDGGDYFLEDDLIPYQIDEQKALEQLLHGQITDRQYKHYVGKV